MKRLLTSLALVAMVALAPNAALADDGVPVEGMLAVNFAATTTSPGIFDVTAYGIGNLSHVGYVFFQLHKTLDYTGKTGTMFGTFSMMTENGDTLTGTYAGAIGVPDAARYNTFSGQITVTGGTGQFQAASGIVSFSAFSNGNSGQAVYNFKGVLHI